ALMGRATSPRVLLNPFYLFRLGVAGTKSLTVGGGDHVWHLGVLLVRMAFGTESETVPDAGTMDTGHAGNVVLWDEEAARQMMEELRSAGGRGRAADCRRGDSGALADGHLAGHDGLAGLPLGRGQRLIGLHGRVGAAVGVLDDGVPRIVRLGVVQVPHRHEHA